MRATKFNEEVLYSADEVVKVDANDIEVLKILAEKNRRRRVRLCVHQDIHDSIHEMLIVHKKNCYVRPHKHLNKTESFHIIEGLVDIILFDENGRINETISMGDYATGRKFFYRLPTSCYHTLLILSEVLVFHEITNGPFKPEESVFAPWAPEENDEDKAFHYMELIASSYEKNCKYGR